MIGAIIDRLVAKRVELEALNRKVEAVEDDIKRIKAEFRTAIEGVGLKEGRNATHSASIVEKVVPQIVNWDHYLAFIDQTKYFHLLQRRPSAPGCTELWESGMVIPGCEQFKKVDISLRSL